MPASRIKYCLFLIGIVVVVGCKEKPRLPYMGPYTLGDAPGDTIYHVVPEFSFINQDSTIVTQDDYRGHIYVSDFFFTHCPTICPIMTSQMARLHDKLKKEGLLGEVKLLSHTVDPKRDTPERLKEYRDMLGISSDDWQMVTGRPAALDDQTRYGYFVTAFESGSAAGGFFHTDQFVLVDKEGHIRGYYDGTSTAEVDQLFEDIILLTELQ